MALELRATTSTVAVEVTGYSRQQNVYLQIEIRFIGFDGFAGGRLDLTVRNVFVRSSCPAANIMQMKAGMWVPRGWRPQKP